jgi:hypothetical protein
MLHKFYASPCRMQAQRLVTLGKSDVQKDRTDSSERLISVNGWVQIREDSRITCDPQQDIVWESLVGDHQGTERVEGEGERVQSC